MSWTQRRSSLVPVAEQHHEHTHHHAQAGHAPTIAPGFLAAAARRTRHDVDHKVFNPQTATESHPSPERHSKARRSSTHAPLIPEGEMFEMYVIPLDQVELKAHPKPAAPEPEKREELPQIRMPTTPQTMKQPFMKATPRGTVVEFELKTVEGLAEKHLGNTRTSDILEARSLRMSGRAGSSPERPKRTDGNAPRPRESDENENENAKFLKALTMSHEQPQPRIVRIYGQNQAQVQAAVSLIDQLDDRVRLASPRREHSRAPDQAFSIPTAAIPYSAAPNGLEDGPRTAARRLSAVPTESSVHTARKDSLVSESRRHTGLKDQQGTAEQEWPLSRAIEAAAEIASQSLAKTESAASAASSGYSSSHPMCGYLQKQSMSCCRRKWDARRYFVLVRGILHEYKNEKHYKDHGLPTASEGICILGGLSVKRSRKSTIVFQLVVQGLTLKLRVADEKTADVWINA